MSGISALKGYRTQFLYSLYHILQEQEKALTFRLEGEEDLDVFSDNGTLQLVIQVKNLSRPLTISDLLTLEGTSFIKRSIQIQKNSPTTKTSLVSFGLISPDLVTLINAKNIVSKDKDIIRKYGLKEDEWLIFKKQTDFIEVKEDALLEDIFSLLKNRFPSIDPLPTFQILLGWLAFRAEKQLPVDQKDLYLEIEEIAIYLSERIAASNQMGRYIVPLKRETPVTDHRHRLSDEFYIGVSARYEHILSNLDVIRPAFLKMIDDVFLTDNVAILQGASGQGKSTLAYRYIHNYCPEELVFEIAELNIPERARESIQTIMAMTKKLDNRIVFLINVNPNTTSWLQIVQEFAFHSNLRFLITIRNEDWFKALSVGFSFLYRAVEINFTKAEAEDIYHQLVLKKEDQYHADFEEAWVQFGTKGPLLEFVYQVTHGESLARKLLQQVRVLEQDSNTNVSYIEFLRIICLADAFGARLSVKQLRSYPQLLPIVNRLEKEYLLKTTDDDKCVTGYHPQRSRLLLDCLFDEFIVEKETHVVDCLSYMVSADIHQFLLNIFNEDLITPANLIPQLGRLPVLDWIAFYGIFKAFLWAGVRFYLQDNLAVFEEAYAKFGDAWYLLTDVYFGKSFDQEYYVQLDFFSDEIREFSKQANLKLKSKDTAFDFVKQIVQLGIIPAIPPEEGQGWYGYGTLLFWGKELNFIALMPVFSENIFKQAFERCATEELATLMLGMYHHQDLDMIRLKYADLFVEKIRGSHFIPRIIFADKKVEVVYLIDILDNGSDFNLNDRSVEIIDLLRRAFPEKSKYLVHGSGHRLDILPADHDLSEKAIPVENLLLEEWVSLNSTLINLFDYRHRPSDWGEYHQKLHEWEQETTSLIQEFNNSFLQYFKTGNYQSLTGIIKNAQSWQPHGLKTPRNIADPLGAFDKTLKNRAKRKKLNADQFRSIGHKEKAAILQARYEPFTKAHSEYKSHLENFLRQSAEAFYRRMEVLLGQREANDADVERLSQYNIFQAVGHQNEYRKAKTDFFSKYLAYDNSNANLGDLYTAAVIWRSFLSSASSAGKSSGLQRISQLKNDIISRIERNCKKASVRENFRIHFLMNEKSANRPLLWIDADAPAAGLLSLKPAFNAIKDAVETDTLSLKKLALDLYFDKFYIISTVQGYTLNSSWVELPLYTFEFKEFEELSVYHLAPKAIPDEFIEKWNLVDWNVVVPQLLSVHEALAELIKVQIYVQHLKDLSELDTEELDELGEKLLTAKFEKYGALIGTSFQQMLDSMADLLNTFQFNDELYLKDDFEQQYQDSFVALKDNMYPDNGSGNGTDLIRFKLSETPAWAERLKICAEKVSMIYYLAAGKYIDRYNQEQAKQQYHLQVTGNQRIANFFKIDFKTIPDNSYQKGRTEKNDYGSTIVHYSKKLPGLEYGIFDMINLIVFAKGSFNTILTGSKITVQTISALKLFVNNIYSIYGSDDLNEGIFTTNEGLDLLAGRYWIGRMWGDLDRLGGKPGIIISLEGHKIKMTIFDINKS